MGLYQRNGVWYSVFSHRGKVHRKSCGTRNMDKAKVIERQRMAAARGPGTVIDMVRLYLQEYGYDGLIDRTGMCGCGLENLAPCSDGPERDCRAAIHNEAPDADGGV